jgi:hypothetical protein
MVVRAGRILLHLHARTLDKCETRGDRDGERRCYGPIRTHCGSRCRDYVVIHDERRQRAEEDRE